MNPFDPGAAFGLAGDGIMRGATVALPTECVRNLLPHGLELGPQTVTPPGTHPVLIGFNDMFRLHTSFPSFLPSLTYHELSVGVPFAHLTCGGPPGSGPGPYYFMPKLFVDSFLAMLGGVAFWGFNKQIGKFVVTGDTYSVCSDLDEDITSLSWNTVGEVRPLAEFPRFEPIRQIFCQPVVSLVPGAVGPFFALSDFDKQWNVALIRPLHTSMDVALEYMVGFPTGRYPTTGLSSGIDQSTLGSFELRVPWRLSMLYPPQ